MGLSTKEQINRLLDEKTSILIALPHHPSTDAIAAGLGMYVALCKLKKNVKIVSNNFHLPPNHSFLPKSEEILADLSSLRKFIITVDVSKTAVEDLNYDILGRELNIYITPKNGMFKKEDVHTSDGSYGFDLIVTIGVPDVEALGPLYDRNAEFFLSTPLINIDHHPENEKYGAVNVVEMTATSTSEIVYDLLNEHPAGVMDEWISTHLLTGIISNTKSFQSATVTPKSLAVASHLIDAGARREEIVRNLYQTKSISALRLWGFALSNIQVDRPAQLVWSRLEPRHFHEAQATESDLPGVIDELIVNAPEAKTVAIVYSADGATFKALVDTPSHVDTSAIFPGFSMVGTKDFTSITIPAKDLAAAQQIVLDRLRAHLVA